MTILRLKYKLVALSNNKHNLYFFFFFFSGQVLEVMPNEHLIQNELPAKFFASDVDAMEGTLPNNLVTLLNHFGPMLKSECRSVQLAAFSLLER